MEVSDYWRYLEDYFKTWEEYGCTLMCDGWTSNNRRHIINVMAYCVTRIVFVRSVDTSGLIDDTLDNAANFKAAAKKLREKHRSIIWVPCTAHCIDLMLEDIGKLDDVRETIDEGKMNRAERITDLLEPLVLVLKLVDADTKPTMGFVYDAMDRAKLAIEQRSKGKYGTYYKKLWKIIDNRWDNQMHQDIHAAVEKLQGRSR
ncbi:Glutathione S-transferase 1 [Cinnamomum micranthum f. kanehirae]|uniref:Glutathione S-transferase 1 n=1 Tax=Cinnamomum micranthum f. kanehirae TaxID=337451 RepID=A0A443PDA4_9MAGN|nr:Glutathione S-transferase 1 [Cinnamomum micranthum f. kanehirae]